MALPTSTWIPIEWWDGEIMTELKLDSQQGDMDYIRDLQRNRSPIAAAGSWFSEFNLGSAHDEESQVRMVIVDDSAHEVIADPPVFMRGPGGLSYPETSAWSPVAATNVAWGASLGTTETISIRWDWRVDQTSGWSAAGTEPAVGVLTSNEANDYLSFWAEVVAYSRTRRIDTIVEWYVRIHVRNFAAIAGRLDEGF